MTTLCVLRKLFNRARQLLKKMGDLAGVGIEPDEQTELIDATELLPGISFHYNLFHCVYFTQSFN